MRASRRSQRGFTVVELAVSVAITATIMLALGGAFLAGYTAISRSNAALGGDNALAGASVALTRDLAGASTVSPLPATLTPGAGTVTFTPPTGAAQTYSIDAARNLLRSSSGTTTAPGRGIAQVQVAAGSAPCQLQVTITPSQGTLGAQPLLVSRRMQGC